MDLSANLSQNDNCNERKFMKDFDLSKITPAKKYHIKTEQIFTGKCMVYTITISNSGASGASVQISDRAKGLGGATFNLYADQYDTLHFNFPKGVYFEKGLYSYISLSSGVYVTYTYKPLPKNYIPK